VIVDDEHPAFLKIGVGTFAFPAGEGRRIVGCQVRNEQQIAAELSEHVLQLIGQCALDRAIIAAMRLDQVHDLIDIGTDEGACRGWPAEHPTWRKPLAAHRPQHGTALDGSALWGNGSNDVNCGRCFLR
jgi:hypothetical protein